MLTQDARSTKKIRQKLQLLTLHFRKLKLVWSPSPYATAQLFEELKRGQEEPNSVTCLSIGTDESDMDNVAEKYNPNVFDFLMKLPGINTKNIGKVMRNGGCLKDLLKKSEDELEILLGTKNSAKMLWQALHVVQVPKKQEINRPVFKRKY